MNQHPLPHQSSDRLLLERYGIDPDGLDAELHQLARLIRLLQLRRLEESL